MLNILERLDLLQDPFLEAGISVPDELPYLRFNNLGSPPTITRQWAPFPDWWVMIECMPPIHPIIISTSLVMVPTTLHLHLIPS